ncbi:hypothetical protein [Pseudoteredinibacter isoporae]|uniref:Uncharacterized protein n=1 Tax=Pseudoteredinibacter isoporae TaxID=570281 RepID=A0A7X0MZ51_9GAMM|nr:hypothetical protein [Pseudoteredinibacter isoporae]MBB6523789.1 hypothetical protein [Pseudoteredinibacter isoporae]NHO89309.1 hypothetical protein [Pseudoteredinibacter isoporae]NIB22416.1 hypothetical protein [Pseudoteredinibacter isoporae]
MNDLIIQLGIVVAIGIGLFVAARLSRRGHEKKYGAKSRHEKIRLVVVFAVTLLGLLLISVKWSVSSSLYCGAAILFGIVGLLSENPGLPKDMLYSAAISSLVAMFVGQAVHGM